MAAAVLEGGAVAMAMGSGVNAGRPSHGTSACCSHVVSSCSSRLVLPTCRGLKAVSFGGSGRRGSAAMPLRSSSKRVSKGVVCEAQETIGGTGQVTDQTFKSLVLESDVPVLVDFWAPWCGPCRMIAPIIDELARQYAGKIRCLKLNTDESPYIATEYGIRSIPTVMIFKRGEKKDTVIGAVPRATLSATIDKHLDW